MEGSLMAYKIFTNGDVLNASELNDNLMNQSVIVFTSTANRDAAIASPVEGMTVYIENNDLYMYYNGSSWQVVAYVGPWGSWAPVLSNGFSNGNGVWSSARYTQIGKTVHFKASFVTGTTSSYGSGMRVSLPINAVASEVSQFSGYVQRSTTRYPILPLDMTSTYITLMASNAAGTYTTQVSMSSTVPHTWATGDQISISGSYEAA